MQAARVERMARGAAPCGRVGAGWVVLLYAASKPQNLERNARALKV